MAQPPLTVPIAGYRHYRGARERLLDLALGTPLRLVRENHPKDSLAVQVRAEDQMLGYVPKANNVDVAWALDGGVAVKAVFAGFTTDSVPAMQIVWP
jgi:hypothetical protein